MITGDIQYVADDLVYVFEHHAGAHGLASASGEPC